MPNTDNVVVLDYAYAWPDATTPAGPFTVSPQAPTPACQGATWRPATRNVSSLPASGQDFALVRGAALNLSTLALLLNTFLRQSRPSLYLNNYNPGGSAPSSSFSFGDTAIPIELPVLRQELRLNLGFTRLNLGTAEFYINSVNMTSVTISALGNTFLLSAAFESGEAEVKGILQPNSVDGLIPDVQIDNAVLNITAAFIPTVAGSGITLRLSNASFAADIQATGACRYRGYDVCDALFGTDHLIESTIENALNDALGSPDVEDALAEALQTLLQTLGIRRPITSFGLYNGALYYVQAPASPPSSPSPQPAVNASSRVPSPATMVRRKLLAY